MDRLKHLTHPPESRFGTSLAEFKVPQAPRHGDQWGVWVLNGNGTLWTLDFVREQGSEPEYHIPLSSIHNSAQLLDWIMQLSEKTYISTHDIGCLVLALDEIFIVQGTLCGPGARGELEPDFLDKRLGIHPKSA